MRKVLRPEFFSRDTKIVAKELIGKFLVRKLNGPSTSLRASKVISVMITETEAYEGFEDRASHAYKGRTGRTEIMFGEPARFYVYLCYGMYYMLNIVTREKDFPAAVLIRGVEGANGPGKLTRFLKIDKKLNGLPMKKSSGLWVEDRGVMIPKNKIKRLPRVGISYAGPIWTARKLRFVIK